MTTTELQRTTDNGVAPGSNATVEPEDRWIVFIHRLGGDMVAVQTRDVDVAERAFAVHTGSSIADLFHTSACCCGPAWAWSEYVATQGPAGTPDESGSSYPSRPDEALLAMGPRGDGTPRAVYIASEELPGLLSLYAEVAEQEPDNSDDDVPFDCC